MSEDLLIPTDAELVRVGPVSEWPRYPILNVSEIEESETLHPLETEFMRYLGPNEQVVHVREYPGLIRPDQPVSPEAIILQATGASKSEEIGQYGPAVASVDPLTREKSRYEYPHGRDALEVADDVFYEHPALMMATAKMLAATQGMRNEIYVPGQPFGQEQRGSIILVTRGGDYDPVGNKFARLKQWADPFYGSADAPAAFINGLSRIHNEIDSNYLLTQNYTDREGQEHPMATAMQRSAQWLLDRSNENPEGLIEYRNPVPNGGGLRNQGWRDSDDALVHADGSWANADSGIAPLDVQAESYDAFRNAAKLHREVFNMPTVADELDARADNLRCLILEKFVVSDKDGTYLASFSDRDATGRFRLGEVVTSAMGRVLDTDILKSSDPKLQKLCDELAEQVVLRLVAADMRTAWGIRTRSTSASSYRPYGYHAGTIWSHDTGRAARGLSNYGYYGLDRLVGQGPTKLHQYTGLHLEFISGDSQETPIVPNRDTYVFNTTHNVIYLAEQRPPIGQTWAASKEIAKSRRYSKIPLRAVDARKRFIEDKILSAA